MSEDPAILAHFFDRQFRNVPNCRLGNDKALVHFDGFGAGIALLKV